MKTIPCITNLALAFTLVLTPSCKKAPEVSNATTLEPTSTVTPSPAASPKTQYAKKHKEIRKWLVIQEGKPDRYEEEEVEVYDDPKDAENEAAVEAIEEEYTEQIHQSRRYWENPNDHSLQRNLERKDREFWGSPPGHR